MHSRSIITILSASVLAGVVLASSNVIESRQSSGLLINPPGFPPLPNQGQALRPSSASTLNLTNIQGDILVGMRKKKELFFFFKITSAERFKRKLASDIFPLITTTAQLLNPSLQPTTAVNLAFSQRGLQTLRVTDLAPIDAPFAGGQAVEASALNDVNPDVNWLPQFKNTGELHGVFLLASDSVTNLNIQLLRIRAILADSIIERYQLQGQSRPGAEEGHEHFGFMDGISQPAVEGFNTPVPGQTVVPPKTILLGQEGDTRTSPAWAKDGSFLVFRQLKQLVPEFNKFLLDNPVTSGVSTRAEGSALMGARMVGRWKSGAPIEITPLKDDAALASDPNRNNNFDFTLASDNSRCPFAAHIRKTNPRSDLPPEFVIPHQIIRAGIPYGPEVTVAEKAIDRTLIERGLAFVSYQSNIVDGFRFQQVRWSNNPQFLPHDNFPVPGFDPIIGANKGQPRNVQGLDLADQNRNITMITDFVQSRGGEYFFTPSLSAILTTLAV